jgi:hypothetical protein
MGDPVSKPGSEPDVLATVHSSSIPKHVSSLIWRWEMAKSGKSGGTVGGVGGKGGGGKGKKGGGGGQGQVTVCMNPKLYDAVTKAFGMAIVSRGPIDGCLKGLMRIHLDFDTANALLDRVARGLSLSGSKKKKKGKDKGSAVAGKLKGTGKKSA